MAQNESMEAILTSIRSGVECAASGTADDVLELVPDDIVEEGGTNGHANGHAVEHDDEGLIDINAFAMSGEAKAAAPVVGGSDPLGENDVVADDVKAEPVAEAPASDPAKQAAEDEFDKLLAELGGDEAKPVEVAPVAMVAAEVDIVPVAAPAVEEVVMVENEAAASVDVVEAAVPADVVIPANGARMVLPALEGVGGLQVAFPAEVLAAALRPMVKDWVAENLPAIVERLVKEEIGKLTQD
ncbi:MAG: DUF2497 domain-containing protein [Alphaproteobacteria bacterium]